MPPEGDDKCSQCAKNFYNPSASATNCTPCSAGTQLTVEGGVSSSQCRPCTALFTSTAGGSCSRCPAGSITLGTGATSCIPLNPTCEVHKTPQAPLLSSILSDAFCRNLTCPSYLNETPDGMACSGCPAGSYGSAAGTCNPCSSSSAGCGADFPQVACNAPAVLCPGFLPHPLAAQPKSLSLDRAPRCVAGSSLHSTARIFKAPGSETETILLWYTAASAASLVLACFFIPRCLRGTAACGKCFERTEPAFRKMDFVFAAVTLAVEYQNAPRGRKLEAKKTAFGGLCFSLFAIGIVAAWVLTVLTFSYSNVAQAEIIDSLATNAAAMQGLPWATPYSADGLQLALPQNVNLQLRLYGQSALCSGAPVNLDYSGVASFKGATGTWDPDTPWLLQSLTRRSGSWMANETACSGTPNVTMLTLSCTSCVLQPDSAITFALPFTCQSFFLEAVFVDAAGNTGAVSLDPQFSTASVSVDGSGVPVGGLIAGVTWTLAPSLSLLSNSAGAGAVNARGFRVSATSAAWSTAPVNPVLDLPSGGIQPLANLVLITVNLPLQPTISHIMVSQVQTLAQLVSALVGFLGLLNVFRSLHNFTKYGAHKTNQRCLRCRKRQGVASSVSNVEEAPDIVHKNPLASGAASVKHPAVVAEEVAEEVGGVEAADSVGFQAAAEATGDGAAPSEWKMETDPADGAVWYTNVQTNESVWELPPAAQLPASATPATVELGGEGSEDAASEGLAEGEAAAAVPLPPPHAPADRHNKLFDLSKAVLEEARYSRNPMTSRLSAAKVSPSLSGSSTQREAPVLPAKTHNRF